MGRGEGEVQEGRGWWQQSEQQRDQPSEEITKSARHSKRLEMFGKTTRQTLPPPPPTTAPPFKPPQMVASPNQTSHINTQRPEVWGRLMHTLLHFSTLQGKHCSCFGMLRCPGRGIVNGRVIVYESRLRTLFGVIVQVL